MDLALYWTIWIALILFATGEAGKRGLHRGGPPAPWAWPVSAAGAAIAIIHIVIAMGARHGWSHDAAWAATARQTASVYGLAWGGGVLVNYAFVAAWLFELWSWRRSPERYGHRSALVTWPIRLFFLVIVFNAAVVFAGGWRRAIGVVLTAVLIASWWPQAKTKRPEPTHL